MIDSFKNLKPFQLAEYICLVLSFFTLPLSWRIATYAMAAMFVVAFLRGIFEDGFRMNQLQGKNRIVCFVSIVFWIVYAVSFLYSDNQADAGTQIGKKLMFLLFPIYFLCLNLSYLTKERVRIVMYGFVSGIFVLYIINFFWAGFDIIFNDNDLERLSSHYDFFKTNDDVIFPGIHHSYFAMMTCLGLVFCFIELFTCKVRSVRIYDIVLILLLIISTFHVASRAGILCLICICVILWIWLTFVSGKTKVGLITGASILMLLLAGYFVFPKSIERFTKTIDDVKNNRGDARLTIVKASKSLIYDNILFGVGVGDRSDKTLEMYHKYRDEQVSKMTPVGDVDVEIFEQSRQILLDSINERYGNSSGEKVIGYIDSIAEIDNLDYSNVKDNLVEYQVAKHCIKYELNMHNQYLETMMTVGIIGVILLLALFIVPIYLSYKNKSFHIELFSLLFIIAFNCLFESVFERQMGIMFFVFFYFLLFHSAFCQKQYAPTLNLNNE